MSTKNIRNKHVEYENVLSIYEYIDQLRTVWFIVSVVTC